MTEQKLCNHSEDYWLCSCSQCREQKEWQSKTEHPCKFSLYQIIGDILCNYEQAILNEELT